MVKPKGVVVQLTKSCNYKCKHCSQNAHSSFINSDELDTERWCQIIDLIKIAGSKGVLFSGGEVLLRRDLPAICHYAKSIGLNIDLITNGSLLVKNIDWINKIKPDSIRISVYSIYKHDYEDITGIPNSYQNLMKLLEYIPMIESRIIIYFVLTNINYREPQALIEKLYDSGIKEFRFLQLADMGRAVRNDLQSLNLENFITFRETMSQMKSRCKDVIIKVALRDEYYQYLKQHVPVKALSGCKLGVENNWFINYKGEMFSCCILANHSDLKLFKMFDDELEMFSDYTHERVLSHYQKKKVSTECYLINKFHS